MMSPWQSPAAQLVVESVVRSLAMAAVVWAAIHLFRLRNLPAQKLAWAMVLALSCAMPGLIRLEAAHPDAVPVVRFALASRVFSGIGAEYQHFAHRITSLRHVVEAASAPQTEAASAVLSQTPSASGATPSSPSENNNSAATITQSAERNPEPQSTSEIQISRPQPFEGSPSVLLSVEPARPVSRWHLGSLVRSLVPAYLFVSAVLLLRVLIGVLLAARLWSQAERASAILDPYARIRISSRIESPVTIGSGILLPASSTSWNRRRMQMVLAHERAHVRQGDFYLQLAAALYAALTWISPLGWFLKRRLAELGEAVSDRAALDATNAGTTSTASSADYAELLLEFASLPRRGFAGVAAGVGMARPSSVQGRIERILNPHAFTAAFTGGRVSAVAAAIVVPCALLIAVSGRRVHAAETQQTTTLPQPASVTAAPDPAPADEPASVATSVTVQPRPEATPAPAAVSATASPQAAPAPAADPKPTPSVSISALSSAITGLSQSLNTSVVALSSEPAPVSGLTRSLDAQSSSATSATSSSATGSSTGTGSGSGQGHSSSQSVTNSESHTYSVDSDIDDDEEEHDHNGHSSVGVLVLNGPNNSFGIVRGDAKVTGKGAEGAAFEKAREQAKGDMMWFERDGKSYVITDPATIDAGIRQWRSSRSDLYDNGAYTLMLPNLDRQLVELKPMKIDVKIPPMPPVDIQKQLADAEAALKKLQAEYPQGKVSALTPEQQDEMRRQISEVIRNLSQLEINDQVILRQMKEIHFVTNDQIQKQLADNRQAMEKAREEARESMRKAREQARIASSQQMQAFFDQALHDGKAQPVQ
ncbi:M56 family metallopeptidase [Silvibacterium dinghuense]|uniref:Peptidase M56 domain-containing protein n=1 Tax=Silvibacterium dinghuense TaxID=1560006 RepID=A0A4Q1SID7_9BACT|nr:M56 family metallopeptidase [Silvibacterium dinghuense]RXS97368.1 hypothetical protein ESZ00_05540 [Silvibacterium dinghuense]GGG98436.1 hypothetical protein GCM10011586_12280 [Silvibacterium dinghuense]